MLNNIWDNMGRGRTMREAMTLAGMPISEGSLNNTRMALVAKYGRNAFRNRLNGILPSKTEQVKSFAKSAAKVIGNPGGTTLEEQERRLAICNGCDKELEGKCSLCGCPLAKIVTYKATTLCKLGKWANG